VSATGPPASVLPRGLGRGGALNLTGAVVQQASLLAVTTLIARALGPAALGRYVLAYALFTLLSLFSLLGFRYAVIRQVTAHVADGNAGAVRATIRLALLVSGTVALGLAGVLALFSSSLAELFHDGDLRLGFVLVAAALPACVTRDLSLAATQGWRSQRAFTVVAWVVEPVLRLVGTAVALLAGFGVPGALVALLVASWVSAGLGVRALRHRLRAFPGVRTAVPWRPLVAFAVTSWATVVAATGLVWVDTLLLGGLAAAADVGTYNVATRLVGLAVFVMAPIDTLFAPHFAHLYHVDDRPRLRATYTAATNWTLRLSVPAFVLLAVFPGDLLALFGPGFVVGATVTFVLAWGQLVNAATGPCGSLLVMSGANRTNMIDNVAALILNIVLNLVLIPPYGIVGAGIAWSVSLGLINLVKLFQVRALLGVVPFDRVTARCLAAGAAAAAVALVLRALPAAGTLGLVADALVVYAVYLAVTLVLGLGPEEVETLRGLRGRRELAREGR
jgi:O-antigen/teichoic acid export membrane protein